MAVVVCLIVASLLLFVRCDGQGNKNVVSLYLGGIVVAGTDNQLFAKVAIGVPFSKTDFKGKVDGIPDSIKTTTSETIRENYYELDFLTSPGKDATGEHPYTITVFNDKESHEYKGVLVIGKPSDTPDQVGGDAGKTGYLGSTDFNDLSISAQVKFGVLMVANPVIIGDLAIAGLSNGEIAGVSFDGTIKWRTKVTDNTIETLQTVEGKLITSDNSGLISLFNLSDLAAGKSRPESTYKVSGVLTAPPTVMNTKMMVVGTSDGKVICVSVPELNKVWDVELDGAINGTIAAIPLGSDKGNLFFNCSNNNIYSLLFDGTLLVRVKSEKQTVKSPIAKVDRFVNIIMQNEVSCRGSDGKEIWTQFEDFDLTGMPLMTSDQIFVSGKTKLKSISTTDGSELWSVDFAQTINSNPFIIGNHILVPTEDKRINVLRINDGLISGSMKVDGSVIPWPYLSNDRLVIADRIGNLILMVKAKTTATKKFDMSQVLVNGGNTNIAHNCLINATLPEKPKLLWTLPGSFAPAITTINRIYLYDITNKQFSCRNAINGDAIWTYNTEAIDANYYGFAFKKGPHDTPMFFTSQGLLIGAKDGLTMLDPDTGKVISKTFLTGIPQSDGKYIILTSKTDLYVLDMAMKLIWSKKGDYNSSNVTIDGDFVYAARRGKDSGAFQILDVKNGSVIFEKADPLFQISSIKVLYNTQFIIVSTLQGPWVFDKLTAKVRGTSGELSMTGVGLYEANFVGNKLYCASEEFGATFDLDSGIATMNAPKDGKENKVRMVSGHWLLTPNSYICMGFDSDKLPKDKNDKKSAEIPKILQIRKLDGNLISSIEVVTNKNFEYGIAVGGSTLILSELGDDSPKLRVYGP